MGQPVVHFEVVGTDGARLRNYYSELFGWEMHDVPGPMDYWTVEREANLNEKGEGIGGGIGGIEDDSSHVTFYVEVPDIRAAIEKAEGLGGKCVMGPHEVPGAGIEIALVADPEGLVTGMVSAVSQES